MCLNLCGKHSKFFKFAGVYNVGFIIHVFWLGSDYGSDWGFVFVTRHNTGSQKRVFSLPVGWQTLLTLVSSIPAVGNMLLAVRQLVTVFHVVQLWSFELRFLKLRQSMASLHSFEFKQLAVIIAMLATIILQWQLSDYKITQTYTNYSLPL